MNIQNTPNYKTNFTGYDARKLKGFAMNSNYAGIADDMKKIGEIENFKVYLFENTPLGLAIKSDKFERNETSAGCWAQDVWGIVKNTLLSSDDNEKPQMLRELLKLTRNNTQKQIQKDMGLPEAQNYVDFLYNLPKIVSDGEEFVIVNADKGLNAIPKAVYDREFNTNVKLLENISNQCHPKGGNYFLTKNANGEDELLIGNNELKKFSINQLEQMFMTDKIHVLPQADYHLDLFIRPLKDKKVLIADDEMTKKVLAEDFQKLQNFIISRDPLMRMNDENSFAQLFEQNILHNPYAKANEVEAALEKAGYEPIRVPGRIYEVLISKNTDGFSEFLLRNLHNYLNAHVQINDKNQLVYITNKSNFYEKRGMTKEIQEKLGIGLEKAFCEAVKPYVDKIYFVSGENNAIANTLMPKYYGGIHCMAMEIPK